MVDINQRDIEVWEIVRLAPYANNARQHSPDQIRAIARSMEQFGWTVPVLAKPDGEIIAGHGRVLAAVHLGLTEAPVITLDNLSESDIRAYRLADNKIAELATWDMELLGKELDALRMEQYDLGAIGFDSEELTELLEPMNQPHEPLRYGAALTGTIADDFLMSPCDVFRVASGDWQARKRAWLEIIPFDYEELGREGDLVMAAKTRKDPRFYERKQRTEERLGVELTTGEFIEKYYREPASRVASGTSMFDPVLSEIMTIWFSPPGGLIYDPFAGDVERGLLAAAKGRRYLGVDVRAEQCEVNAGLAAKLGWEPTPRWVQGDSRSDLPTLWAEEQADLVFTCPPYWNLEKYSDDPGDLSNMSLADFNAAHGEIIAASLERLKDDRFAVWVIGDVRLEARRWARIVDSTIDSFEAAGAALHNEATLITPMGGRRIGLRQSFIKTRTLTSLTESVLIFCKGDAKAAAEALGEVAVGEPPDEL